jgi:altronate dehydratase
MSGLDDPKRLVLQFEQAARLPAALDNAAIALKRLEAGSGILLRHIVYEISHTVLEGHRFAVERIETGRPLLSWGLPFGIATRPIEAGEYLCNAKILEVLKSRAVNAELPGKPNFTDYSLPFTLDEARLRTGVQAAPQWQDQKMRGFRRPRNRGTGARNYIVVIGTNSGSGALARQIARRFAGATFRNIDGVVAVEHTEGGGRTAPKNFEVTLRTLAGFMLNPNVGAVLAVDAPGEILSNAAVQNFCAERGYPMDEVPHRFYTRTGGFEHDLHECVSVIESWVSAVSRMERTETSLSGLRVGLQCGGSDAFSGISANPLAGMLAREVVARGGSANLAETDELIGAESYVLENVKDIETARSFLRMLARYQEWAAWHGQSAEGNPSGGNMLHGLYNIAIKSIGAARKKDPESRLDYVIDFGERMARPGFYFMNSPGNDLESIAGQVAAGCNLILFATGNGSITNFPFVPAIKIMTTTPRFELLRNEMDFNAGRLLDGEPKSELGREALELMTAIASGQKSAGERAGHSQAQLWREWRQGPERRAAKKPLIRSKPLLTPGGKIPERKLGGEIESHLLGKVALVLPTSLCSGQVGEMIAAALNQRFSENPTERLRAVSLPHTEGCGNSTGESEELFLRTMTGYLTHPLVGQALLLEHGCEKTHHDAFKRELRAMKLSEGDFGWASVQLDGGIEKAVKKALLWFQQAPRRIAPNQGFSVALLGQDIPPRIKKALQEFGNRIIQAGGAVIISERSELWRELPRDGVSLDYGEKFSTPGLHSMACPTDDFIEIITGLGATGVQMIVAYENDRLLPGNPLIPMVQVQSERGKTTADVDLILREHESAESNVEKISNLVQAVARASSLPQAWKLGNTAFQITRGYEGISL